MAMKYNGVIIESLTNTWSATSNPADGTTCVCNSPVTANTFSRHNLTILQYSIANNTAASIQAVLSVRDNAANGTVLSQVRLTIPAASSNQFTSNLNLPGTQGNRFFAEFGTPATSVFQNITIAGWQENRA